MGKSTEDGTQFRVYKLGSLEVRTTKECDGKEVIGAVYSHVAVEEDKVRRSATNLARVAKVVEYVEQVQQCDDTSRARCHYYLVLKTDQGDAILTEQLPDGTAMWRENPVGLEDRNSLAKVTRTAECHGAGVIMLDLRKYKDQYVRSGARVSSKHYAQAMFSRSLQLGVDSGMAKSSDAEASPEDEYEAKKQAKFQE